MSWYADLTPCNYFGARDPSALLAVGWLEAGREYTTGPTDRSFVDRLQELLRDPWQPVILAGGHGCDLCGEAERAYGSRCLYVPGAGVVYVCPELIVHYIVAHDYRPPDEFVAAVLRCPDMGAEEYMDALNRNSGKSLAVCEW